MNESTTTELTELLKLNPIIEWASQRPHWEKYIWRLQLEHGDLTEEQIQESYRLFQIENGILPKEQFEPIDLSHLTPPLSVTEKSKPLVSIKGIKNVNALPEDTEIEFGSKLTVCYGSNGSGKSGYGRLIASACFTRGDRKIYPNLRAETIATNPATADFTIGSDNDEEIISYTLGDLPNQTLKRFSMFDSHSADIQLNKENMLQFTPAQLAVFDRVNAIVKSMENRLADEKHQRRKENPLSNSFGDTSSIVSITLLNPDLKKNDEELLSYSEYPIEGDKKVEELKQKKELLIKKNIVAEEKKLGDDRGTLHRFKSELEIFSKNYTNVAKDTINKHIKDVNEKQNLVAQLGVETFNDGAFKSTGSEKWKSLLRAAKELHEHEVELVGAKVELSNCLLCHQPLTHKEHSLFGSYWEFLRSTAEIELENAKEKLGTEKKRLEQVRLTPPRNGDDESVIKTLMNMGKSQLVNQLNIHLEKANSTLLDWESKIESLTEVDNKDIPEFLLTSFDILIAVIDDNVSKLMDPKTEIETLDKQITELQHRKLASNVIAQYKDYLTWCRWLFQADKVTTAGTKRNYTDGRSALFDAIVTEKYIQVFQEECTELRASIDLRINKRGSDGKTLVSKKLSFSRDKTPSEVLSEGEQKVCAIADFLSEARLDPGNWGIIFDDPVTSLDHERKEKIAERLVAQTSERQVIVFTHDITFLLALLHYAELGNVDCKKLTIRKLGHDTGIADGRMPWLSENCKARKGILTDQLQKIGAMIRKGAHEVDIEKEIKSWSEALRESWERAVEERLMKGTIERFRPSVETSRLKRLSITQALLDEVEAGMTETSKWVHDRAAGLNVAIPDEAELTKFLDRYIQFLLVCSN
jgi:hypothetical protein